MLLLERVVKLLSETSLRSVGPVLADISYNRMLSVYSLLVEYSPVRASLLIHPVLVFYAKVRLAVIGAGRLLKLLPCPWSPVPSTGRGRCLVWTGSFTHPGCGQTSWRA